MGSYAIIDDKGIVEDTLKDFDEAMSRLTELRDENFKFVGKVKIIEIIYVV